MGSLRRLRSCVALLRGSVDKRTSGRSGLQVAAQQEVRYGTCHDDGLRVAPVQGLEAVGLVGVEVCRVAFPEDAGVRDIFSFLLARDTMHQNQWLAAIEELKADGLEDTPVPSNFPQEREFSEVAYRFMNFSEGEESAQGRWARGPSMDGKGEIEYVGRPAGDGTRDGRAGPPVEPRLYSTPKQPYSPPPRKVIEEGDTVTAGTLAPAL